MINNITSNKLNEITLAPDIQKERYKRLVFSIIFFIAAVLIIFLKLDSSLYHDIAYTLCLVQGLWIFQFCLILFSIQHLHMIHVSRRILANTKFLVVPHHIYQYENVIISSISALSALRGSNTFAILGKAMNISFGMTFAVVSLKIEQLYNNGDRVDTEPQKFMASFGGSLLAHWELDTHLLSTVLHYLGAFIAFFGTPIAFGLQQNWNILSVVLMIGTYLFVSVFSVMGAIVSRQTFDENSKWKVHIFSLISILLELIGVSGALTCGILFIYCMEGDYIFE